MRIGMLIVAILGGLAIWRRRQIEDGASRISSYAKNSVHEARSGRKELLTQLGRHVYADSIGDNGVDHEADIARIVSQLQELDVEVAADDESAVAAAEASA